MATETMYSADFPLHFKLKISVLPPHFLNVCSKVQSSVLFWYLLTIIFHNFKTFYISKANSTAPNGPLDITTYTLNQNPKLTCPKINCYSYPKFSSHRFPIPINDISIFPVSLAKALTLSQAPVVSKYLLIFVFTFHWSIL